MSDGMRTESAFSQALRDLKRRGSNLLLVGTPDRATRAAATDRLMGETDVPVRRRRMFVFTDNTYVGEEFVDEAAQDVHVVAREQATRGAAAAATGVAAPTAGGGVTRQQVDGERLGELSWAVGRGMRQLDAETARPGELRVCVDSLTPLVDEHSYHERMQFLHTITNRVRAASGMGHYHLSARYDDDIVADLEPLFDAVIDLRVAEGRPEHRWHIGARDLDSGWLPL